LFKRLGDAKNETVADPEANTDNSQSKKTRKGDFGELLMEVPRDRAAALSPNASPSTEPAGAALARRSCFNRAQFKVKTSPVIPRSSTAKKKHRQKY